MSEPVAGHTLTEDPELFRLFKAESGEHLARLDAGLLRLENAPTDAALLEEMFRESHSLKGAAHMLGLAPIETAAHDLESLLNAARKGETTLAPDTIEAMNAALAELRRLVQAALAGVVPPPGPPPAPPAVPTASPVLPVSPPAAAPGAAGEAFRIETVRVETRRLDDLLTQVDELAVVEGRTQYRLALMEELLEQWAALERGRRHRNTPGARAAAATVPARQAEAVLRFGSQLKRARDALFDDSARLESAAKLLKAQVRELRLLPLATVFALFPRLVRDLALERGKQAELVIEGGDIAVDKRILEEMKDPLMHLIRNAIDHGIEPPAEREQLGKPRGGTVRLRAVRDNDRVLLEVGDDGRGLDLAAIRHSAAQHGFQDEAALAAMSAAQLQQLIFMPGFSTSARVTELSGRGVGLDVVRINVERLKGSIRLESAAGGGLTVQVSLPLSLASTRLLLASAGGRLYGLPAEFVQTSRRVRAEDIFSLEGRPAVLLDGQPVLAARLADLLQLPPLSPSPAPTRGEGRIASSPLAGEGWGEGGLACIVIEDGEERLGLLADDLAAEEEVVPKPLGAPLKRVRNVAALAMLASGEICVVLNPADLLRTARRAGIAPPSAPHSGRPAAARPVVLLVEDSALIRAMEQRILGDGGYEVVTAVDGVDALAALGRRPFAAVVSDIVMPNMDGLALTARIRAEPRHKELPIILVTTLASDADRRRGLDAGANAYIPKPSFDQRVLLDTLKRLIVT